MQDSSCSSSIKWCKMCKIMAENLPLSPPGCAELRYPVLTRLSSTELYLHAGEPQLGMHSALSPIGARKAGSSDTMSFFQKELAPDMQKNLILCRINEDSPKTAIICEFSFFYAVAGEDSSVPACCPENCCAKASDHGMWQAEKAPRCLMN